MPSFLEQRHTLDGWRAVPARERLDSHRAALTFDDGPDPDATPLVLEVLDDLGLKASFFMTGEQAELHPRLAARVAEEGHEIALHGFAHRRDAPPGDLERGLATIEEATGKRATRFRPPYGCLSSQHVAACAELALEPVFWSAWGLDWEAISPERIAELVLRDLTPGAIVVLHDSARYAPRESAAPTALALWAIAEGGIELGPL